jgi:hypothetical protein
MAVEKNVVHLIDVSVNHPLAVQLLVADVAVNLPIHFLLQRRRNYPN